MSSTSGNASAPYSDDIRKLIEESPSPALTPELRAKMGAAAVTAGKWVNYEGAGTIEFLFSNGNFYFMEANTRVQVEHPVTEMVTGIDIVKEQIRVASGLPLSMKQEDVKSNGWAIECRINAEDPLNNFAPSPGKLKGYRSPGGVGIRVDSGVYTRYTIPADLRPDGIQAHRLGKRPRRGEGKDAAGALRVYHRRGEDKYPLP